MRIRPADTITSSILVISSLLIYEAANLISLYATGLAPHLEFANILEGSVIVIIGSTSQMLISKTFQVLLLFSFYFLVYYIAERNNMVVTSFFSISLALCSLSTFYWEIFSFVKYLSFQVHLLIFGAILLVSEFYLANLLFSIKQNSTRVRYEIHPSKFEIHDA